MAYFSAIQDRVQDIVNANENRYYLIVFALTFPKGSARKLAWHLSQGSWKTWKHLQSKIYIGLKPVLQRPEKLD